MVDQGETGVSPYLTTREVADLLRVKERKVYDLAASGEIPHRRITGKLLFPRSELLAWIEGPEHAATAARPPVLTGSHDPLLDWAVRDSDCGLAILLNGSSEGLDRFLSGQAALCGLHLRDEDGWNVGTVRARAPRDCVLIGWAKRQRGLLLSPAAAKKIKAISDLKGRRVALRQPGAGATALFDRLLAEAGLRPEDLEPAPGLARTESDAAAEVAAGQAEAAMGLSTLARPFNLEFLPLVEERFDLLIDRRAYFTEEIQRLLRFARRPALARKAEAMGGYDLSVMEEVRWLSP
jgi:excisionase family DNA binding protein